MLELRRAAQENLSALLIDTLKKTYLIYAYAREREFPTLSNDRLVVAINLAVAVYQKNVPRVDIN